MAQLNDLLPRSWTAFISRSPSIPTSLAQSAENTITPDSAQRPQANPLRDREERAVAALLTRFRNLVSLAASPVEEGATKEVAAAQAFQMEVESSALVRASEELLQLTRELKEMWLFGPLRGIKEGEGEGKMDEDSTKVGEMVEALLKKTSEGSYPANSRLRRQSQHRIGA